MTAAQQKSRERFKKAIAEAKKLRKKNPKLSQAQAVKQAWAILYSSGKVSGVKKKAAKKAAVKKSSYHKDTKSHNVNIRVMSGVVNIYKVRDSIEENIKYYLEAIERTKKNLPTMSILEKKRAKQVLVNWKKIIIKLKKQLRDQNKLINDLLK